MGCSTQFATGVEDGQKNWWSSTTYVQPSFVDSALISNLIIRSLTTSSSTSSYSTRSSCSLRRSHWLSSTHTTMEPQPSYAIRNLLGWPRFPGSPLQSTFWFMLSCIGTTSKVPVVFAYGGRSGSPVFKSFNSWLTSVRNTFMRPYVYSDVLLMILVFVYYASYTYFTSTYFPWMPNSGKCAGEEFAAFAGMGILSSYLLLFISFYFATYKKTGKTGRPRRNTGKQAVIAMKDLEVPTVSAHEKANGNSKANGSSVSPRAGGSRSRKA